MRRRWEEIGNIFWRAFFMLWIVLLLLLLFGRDYWRFIVDMHLFVWNLFR